MSKEAMKLVPVEPTEEMLKAMDECSKDGYDERLYAGHAASVYMAAVDAAPTQPLRHEHAEQLAKLGWQYFECPACGSEGAKAFPKPAQQVPVAKLRVILEDRPIYIELAKYKRMFEAACSALGAIGKALGIDEEEGGAEPILAAIEELKAQPKKPEQEPVATVIGKFLTRKDELRTCIEPELSLGTKLYTSPPAQRTWVGLTDDDLVDVVPESNTPMSLGEAFVKYGRAIEAKLKEKNT